MRERTQGNEQCLLFTLAPRFSVLRAFANRQFDPEVVPPPHSPYCCPYPCPYCTLALRVAAAPPLPRE